MPLRTDFTSQEYYRNPTAAIERLRAYGPVVEVKFPIIGRVWIATTQELAGRVLKDGDTFTLRKDGVKAGDGALPRLPLGAGPPFPADPIAFPAPTWAGPQVRELEPAAPSSRLYGSSTAGWYSTQDPAHRGKSDSPGPQLVVSPTRQRLVVSSTSPITALQPAPLPGSTPA
jgi:hypothetical protein